MLVGVVRCADSRILGTSIGAVAAITLWEISPANPYVLSIIGALFSTGCFYLIANTANWQPFGRFILLTYNLSALYAYTLTLDVDEDDDDEGGLDPIITSIALHRIISVCVGVLWGMFITSYIWPISARHDMRVGLSELYLHLGWFFRTSKHTGENDQKPNGTSGTNGDVNGNLERSIGVENSPLGRIRPFLDAKQEIALQGLLVHLKGLLNAAANEPRLKVCH